MPSLVPSLTGTGVLPEPLQSTSGRVVDSVQWLRAAGVLHHAHARGQLHRVSQSWPGDICRLGTADGPLVHGWRLPMHSSTHTMMTVWAECQLTVAAAAKLRFTSSAGTLDLNPPVGAYGWVSGTLLLPGADTADITMGTSGLTAGGEEVMVRSVSMYITPLASPLANAVATATTGDFTPLGSATLGPDYPLSSSRLITMRSDILALYARRRCIYTWTGLSDDVVSYVGASNVQNSQQNRPHLAMPKLQKGDLSGAASYKVNILSKENATQDTHLRVAIVPDGQAQAADITVATGAASGWYSTTLDLRQSTPCVPGMGFDTTGLVIYPSTSLDAPAPHSTAPVLSVSIWGV